MAKVQITIPQRDPLTVLHIPVRITDINYGNHLGNDSLVSILHEARMQFLQQHGFTEMNAGGTSLIMKDLAIDFKHESFYGDELTVDIYCTDISKVSFCLIYEITTMRENGEVLIAMGQTTMVCYDYQVKKITSIPEKLRQILN